MNCVALSVDHEKSLAEFLTEFVAAGEKHIPAFLPDPTWSFQEIVEGFDRQSRGEDLPEGWVPSTTRFLVDEGRILGVFNVRHWLTDSLREFGGHVGYSVRPSERRKGFGVRLLEAAKILASDLGIERMLVTCNAENTASSGVIERCGGVLESRHFCEPVGQTVCHYWINLSE